MSKPDIKSWTKTINDQTYLISTDINLHSPSFINSVFAMEEMYWAKPIDLDAIDLLLRNSCTLGLHLVNSSSTSPTAYTPSDVTQIGISRLITDYVTFAYLTDVFILPEHQDGGLGKWLIASTKEVVLEMKFLRRFMLLTRCGPEYRTIPFYEKELGMQVHVPGVEGLVTMVRKKEEYPEEEMRLGRWGTVSTVE
ncbi:hypothetical protein P152DRAFT_405506 [Eremomyces bilateralis CBS 781.70]|uniref:N-acetyltransferase domain-containing protein n=1 Tax=Eremomyces bilateralis CBS 781.70 TaxID=1392243 RepID=A0A6G1FRH2_9PEZI|nr:uncharacterized protein P152DRAFT_405506 [Eremomyces bilateralis CBS 781.70]KAF1808394.1 hypothetical protein P152DRAFT_405506 [Eremomyces bilateralis CBS 781.70]